MTTFPTRPALAGLAVAALLGVSACGSSGSSTASDDPTTADAPITTSGSSTGSTGPTQPSASATPLTTATVYFVGDTPDGQRLYAEQRQVSASDPLGGATALLVTGAALDPDYRSLLPTGMDVTEVGLSDGTIVVHVGDAAQLSGDASTTKRQAQLAVQQLVYTLDSVSGTDDKIQVVQGSGATESPVALLGDSETTSGASAATPLDTLAAVNILTPTEGASESASFTASGVASSFEGNVPWDLHRGSATGPIVRSGAATASGYGAKLYPWKTTVSLRNLSAGSYTFVARTDDPSGKGSDVTQDSRQITVS